MLTVHPSLIKRSKSHISLFKCGVKFICGMNGNIFITLEKSTENSATSYERIARVANCVRILEGKTMHINGPIVEHLYEQTVFLNIPCSDMLTRHNQELIVDKYLEEMS